MQGVRHAFGGAAGRSESSRAAGERGWLVLKTTRRMGACGASANDNRGSGAARAASAERAVAESAGEWATAAGGGGEDATRSGDGRDVIGRADTSDDGAGGAA